MRQALFKKNFSIISFSFLVCLISVQGVLAYSSLLYNWTYTTGGTSAESGEAITIDSSGNIYLTGCFQGTDVDFDPTTGTDNKSSNGDRDIFLTKINSDASYAWTYTMGGISDDYGLDVVTSSGNIYLTGRFQGTDVDFDPTAGIDNKSSNGMDDIFLTKINSDASYAWTYTMGGTSVDRGLDVITSSGNIYLTGRFRGTDVDFDPTAGTDNKTSNGGDDIFLTKINSDASYAWTYTIGGTDTDHGLGVTTSSGNVYLTGCFQGTNVDFDPTAGTDNKTSNGSIDIFLTKINSDASYAWTYTMGGTNSDSGSDVIASSGNIYLTGRFQGTDVDFDPTAGTDNKTSNGEDDIFLTKINSDASYAWTYTIGGTSADRGLDVAIDSSRNIYFTGFFMGTDVDFDPTAGTDNKTSNGNTDIFLTKINSDASYDWTFTTGGTDSDYGQGIITKSSGLKIYFTGFFSGTDVDFDPTAGIDNKTSNGNSDIFLTKFSVTTSLPQTGCENCFSNSIYGLIGLIIFMAPIPVFLVLKKKRNS